MEDRLFVAIRLDELSNKEFFDTETFSNNEITTKNIAQLTDIELLNWSKANKVVRISEVKVIEES